MPNEPPKSRPEPPAAPAPPQPAESPSPYGGQWGKSGKQNPEPKYHIDRPDRIEPPRE